MAQFGTHVGITPLAKTHHFIQLLSTTTLNVLEKYEMNTPKSHGTDNPAQDNQLVPEMTAADLLGLSIRTLQNWRVRGGGPCFVRISARCIRYRISDVEDWIEGRTVSNTSEAISS